MHSRSAGTIAAAAAAAATFLSGCSSPTPLATNGPGGLPPNTARVTVDGRDLGTSSVNCTQVQFAWTINVGDKSSGSTAVIESGGGPLVARSVRLRDVDGFSGTYWDGNHGNAQATSDGGIWTVTGKMDGFNIDTDGIDRASRDFTIKANC